MIGRVSNRMNSGIPNEDSTMICALVPLCLGYKHVLYSKQMSVNGYCTLGLFSG